jgi:hypothetical protein
MINSDYNIVSPDADTLDWSGCKLFIALNRHFFQYTILQNNHAVVALKYYRLTPSPERGVVEWLEEIIAGDALLNKNIPVAAVIYKMPESELVPQEYYDERMNRDLISLVHGDLKRDIILSEKIRSTGIYNIYLVPADVHRFLDNKFSPLQYRHFYSLWIEWLQQQEDKAADSMYVMFYPNELMVMLTRNNEVVLTQSFTYETTEDVGYHLLNTYQQHHLSPTELPLKVSGMIARDSAMYDELLKYFMLVETVPVPEQLSLVPDFELFPPHFFSPILKMALCV